MLLMELLKPDLGYVLWGLITLAQCALIITSLWMLFKSKKLGANLVLALLIASLFIPIIGPVMSIFAIQKHNKRTPFQRKIYNGS